MSSPSTAQTVPGGQHSRLSVVSPIRRAAVVEVDVIGCVGGRSVVTMSTSVLSVCLS
jgi:hypothetical protein